MNIWGLEQKKKRIRASLVSELSKPEKDISQKKVRLLELASRKVAGLLRFKRAKLVSKRAAVDRPKRSRRFIVKGRRRLFAS